VTQPALKLAQPAPDADDASLLTRARAGDERAIDLLVGRYLKDVYAVTGRLLSDRELAQDAAQDALISAVKGLARFRGDASFRTWIMRIAMNSARSVARRRTRRREVSLEVVAESVDDGTDVATQAVRHDEAARALELLAKLPEKQRMAVTLRVQQGLSYQEIGAVLDCAEGAARVNYHLGVKRLREMMK
jgi:RNA polymerase sigma-70 factor (ECF subfamily)